MYIEKTVILRQAPCLGQGTLYYDPQVPARFLVLYLHGGGLLYGRRQDLPELHRQRLTGAGYPILALDYPLAPAAGLPDIFRWIREEIAGILAEPPLPELKGLPYILWGRSSGGYLALLTACKCAAAEPVLPAPAAVLSYYGYGFLTDDWADRPAPGYLALPPVPPSCLRQVPQEIHCEGDLDTHFSVYVYARQTGLWRSLFRGDLSQEDFLRDYSLQGQSLPCPLFCTHALEDPDVPFAEFQALEERFHPRKYLTGGNVHDFDRNDTSYTAKKLLDQTLKFLNTL